MNIFFHALLGLLLAKLLGINSILEVMIGVLFSVDPDFDHIPYLKKTFRTGRFGVESRLLLHELVGFIFVLSRSCLLRFSALTCFYWYSSVD